MNVAPFGSGTSIMPNADVPVSARIMSLGSKNLPQSGQNASCLQWWKWESAKVRGDRPSRSGEPDDSVGVAGGDLANESGAAGGLLDGLGLKGASEDRKEGVKRDARVVGELDERVVRVELDHLRRLHLVRELAWKVYKSQIPVLQPSRRAATCRC